jgi:hypothetical protein
VFRLFYLLIPLAFSIVIVILFERRKLDEALHRKETGNEAKCMYQHTDDVLPGKPSELS